MASEKVQIPSASIPDQVTDEERGDEWLENAEGLPAGEREGELR